MRQSTTAVLQGASLRHWRSFEATAAFGSVSRAAEALDLAQSVVSVQVRQLEEALRTPLFEKRARPMVLTAQGQVMLRHARAILSEVRMAEDAALTLAQGLEGVLHLGLVMPAHYFVPALIKAFAVRSPRVSVQVTLARRDMLLTQLAECRLDLALMGYPPAEADVEAETFARHPHVVVAPAGHALAGREVAWSELAAEPIVLREAGSSTRQLMEHMWQSRSLRPAVAAVLPGNETVKAGVMAGLGISLMSAHAVQVELQAGRLGLLRLPDTPLLLDWCVVRRRDRPPSAAARAFSDLLMQQGVALTACPAGGASLPVPERVALSA
jgi:DNA-binding transcriptional LysR family regulator